MNFEKKKIFENFEKKKNYEKIFDSKINLVEDLKNLENFTNNLLIFIKKNNMEKFIFDEKKNFKEKNFISKFQDFCHLVNNTESDCLEGIDKGKILDKEGFVKIFNNKLQKL